MISAKEVLIKLSLVIRPIVTEIARRMLVAFVLCLVIFPVVSGSRTAVLILARGGSKGLPLKNLQLVGGKSLLTRGIHTAKISGVEDVTVSTDHPWIALEALRSGADIFARSRVTASDWAPSIWGVQEFLTKRQEIDILLLLQVTSPFIQPISLRRSLRKLTSPIAFDCIFSVTRAFKLRWAEINNKVIPRNFKWNSRPRRQDWQGELYETGAFYITRRGLLEKGQFQNDKYGFISDHIYLIYCIFIIYYITILVNFCLS